MSIFTDVITVYNHRSDDTYQRTVIYDVQYSKKTVKTVSADGRINLATAVNVTIPDSAVCTRKYIAKREFKQLEDTGQYWTLDEAGNLDIIIQGEIAREITEDYRIKNLKSDYDCVTVASISDNRNRQLLKHIKAVCK